MLAWGVEREIEKVKNTAADTRPERTTRTLGEASERYPSVQLSTGERLHVFERNGEWCVWLNTEVSDFDGLCLGMGDTRDEAVAAAVQVLEAATAQLQQPATT